mgnify:CR=1 FL=1
MRFEPEQSLVEAIFRAAKERDRVMSEDEVMQIVKFVTEASQEDEPLPLDTLEGWKVSLREGS